MAQKNRYAGAVRSGRRSGIKRARRRRKLLLLCIGFVICAGLGFWTYRSIAKTEKPAIILPTPTPPVKVKDMTGTDLEVALPYRLYTERYTSGFSEDALWMEDFDDTRKARNIKGMYLTAEVVNKKLDYILNLLDTTELDAIVIDVKNDDGSITVHTDSPMLAEINNTHILIQDMPALIQTFKEHGVYCIARVVCFRDIFTVRNKSEFGVHMPDGSMMKDNSGYTWMNPFNQDVWEYLTEIGRECAKMGFDEVNFDYCRFSTDSKVKEADYGKELTRENKEEAITGFVRYACENLKPLGVFVSVDVFGVVLSSEIDAAAVGQNYADMSSYLDYICPMVYPSHYGNGYYNLKVPDAEPYPLIYNAMQDSKKRLAVNVAKGRCAKVRPWLQAFTATWVKGHIEYGGKELRDQINATYDAGYTGWLLWNAAGAYGTYESGLEKENESGGGTE